eukprot:CAMPEP_0204309486 /NCGR_PEP_ID=MMETSP0469-20131031/1126_1 /ASSEMBLY_ACC=CAM_ASM_000384 /TAXON_ID=2969 /ORGANISM="Oxyrrhis marina" /LENGTH=196 /DNA_ID=CAMNT_0051289115 /DNA_START=26 /DNA_END=616 /DNA_ORIENTATION=+
MRVLPCAVFLAGVAAESTTSPCGATIYNGSDYGSELCFCQLAENPGCAGLACSCSEGCDVQTPHTDTVTFANFHNATGCSATTALLTIPRNYYSDISDLRDFCPHAWQSMLVELLIDAFITYQTEVAAGPVQQCIHGADFVSTKWLHLHTFCVDGQVDGMPKGWPFAHCETMTEVSEAGMLAAKFSVITEMGSVQV